MQVTAEREIAIRLVPLTTKFLVLEALETTGTGREKVETIAQEQRRIGWAEGWTEGRTEGWAEGRTEGRTEGWAEGWTEGRTEGWAEGWTEGRTEAKAELFFLLARKKFKEFPSKWETQVLAASPEQIDDWMVRTIDAPDIESVFNDGKPNGDFRQRRTPCK